MKTLAALGALVAAGAAAPVPAGPWAGGSAQEPPSPRIAVIRYDAESIRLTDALVMSLCRHQVKLAAPAELELALRVVPLDGEPQPPGVHVTGLIISGADGLDADTRAALLGQGITQLETALTKRLLLPQIEPLERGLAHARELERELVAALDASVREIADLESQRDAGQELADLRTALRRAEFELDAATRTLDGVSERLDRARADEEAKVTDLARQIDEIEARIRDDGLTPEHSAYRRLQTQLAFLGEQLTVVRMEAAHRSREAEQVVETAAAAVTGRDREVRELQRSIEGLEGRAPSQVPEAELARARITREVLERRLSDAVERVTDLEARRSALVPPSVDLW